MEGFLTRWTSHTLLIEQVHVPGGVRLRGHGHDLPHLCFVNGGAFDERDRGRDRRVAAGTLRVSPAGDEHDLRFAPSGGACLLLLIDGDVAAETAGGRPRARVFVDCPLAGLAHAIAAELADPDPSPLVLELQALELLARATRAPASRTPSLPPPWLLRTRDALHAQPTVLSAKALAADAGVHPVYLARAFRAWFGCAPGDYARRVRLAHARELILATSQPLARIAAAAGFADQAHLTRAMRRRLGVTPAALRAGRARDLEVATVQDAGRLPA